VSFPKFHYNDLFPTSWQLPRLRGSYRETCVMDFGHNNLQPSRFSARLHTTKQYFVYTSLIASPTTRIFHHLLTGHLYALLNALSFFGSIADPVSLHNRGRPQKIFHMGQSLFTFPHYILSTHFTQLFFHFRTTI